MSKIKRNMESLHRSMNLSMTFADECWITKVIGESARLLEQKGNKKDSDKLVKVNSWILTHIQEQ